MTSGVVPELVLGPLLFVLCFNTLDDKVINIISISIVPFIVAYVNC